MMETRYKTLGQLRANLQRRLGFIATGPGATNNRHLMDSFLQEAHSLICDEVDVKSLNKRGLITLSKGSRFYDWHNDADDEDIDPGRVQSIWVQISDLNPVQLLQGISEHQRSYTDLRAYPERWDNVNGQIELWPTPDQSYQLIIWYTAPRARFERDSDRPSVPDELVFAYALSMAKAHYRHSDAQVYGTMFERTLRTFKARQHENRRYFMQGNSVSDLPQVARTADGGYKLRA